jgi:deoxyribonuclease V
MKRFRELHPWDVTPQGAKEIQEELRSRVITVDQLGPVNLIAGVDVGFEANGRITRAAVAVLCYPGLELVQKTLVRQPTSFPYVPGLLSFREVPAILNALAQLDAIPDLFLCDGQGYAHPRRFGLACHLGLLCDLPSIGVAKSRLIGTHEPVGQERGSWQPLMDEGEVVGAALRTRTGVKPVFVSLGYRISRETAIDFTLQCSPKFRISEPIRQAHRLASEK